MTSHTIRGVLLPLGNIELTSIHRFGRLSDVVDISARHSLSRAGFSFDKMLMNGAHLMRHRRWGKIFSSPGQQVRN
jgi:hypothetical protein